MNGNLAMANQLENPEGMSGEEMDLINKRKEMSRESWIKNVMRIYPEATREATEALHQKLFEIVTNKEDKE